MLSVWGYIFAIFFIVVPSVGAGVFLNRQLVKDAWNWCSWCKYLWAYSKKYPVSAFTNALFVIFLIAFGVLFPWFYSSFIYSLYMDIRDQIDGIMIGSKAFRNVSLSIGGSITLAIALLGVFLTVIRNILTRQQNRTDEERLVTEQISRSIDQIGAYKQSADGKNIEPNVEVRMGGLYSLERIMRDSLKDEEAIAKIFNAYVRENAKK